LVRAYGKSLKRKPSLLGGGAKKGFLGADSHLGRTSHAGSLGDCDILFQATEPALKERRGKIIAAAAAGIASGTWAG